MKRVWSVLFAAVVGLAVAACSDSGDQDNPYDRLEKEVASIDSYLSGKGITDVVKDPTGVRLVIFKLGTGYPAKLKMNTTVSVDYEGRLFPDGIIFDNGTIKKPVTSFIDGWQIALSRLPEGSRARVYIPSAWGYGPTGSLPDIPQNAPLEFDIEFNELVRSTTELAQLRTDTATIDTYLTSKEIAVTKDTLGLRYVVTQQGTGAVAGLYDKLKFNVKYRLLSDDTKTIADFDFEPSGDYFSRAVDQDADGIKKVLTTIPVGSKATLYLPSMLAYGPQGAKDNTGTQVIPANANIIVDLELKEIVTN